MWNTLGCFNLRVVASFFKMFTTAPGAFSCAPGIIFASFCAVLLEHKRNTVFRKRKPYGVSYDYNALQDICAKSRDDDLALVLLVALYSCTPNTSCTSPHLTPICRGFYATPGFRYQHHSGRAPRIKVSPIFGAEELPLTSACCDTYLHTLLPSN